MAECEIHRVHHPSVAVVHDMLVFPAFMQIRVYGEVREHESVKICGTGQDNVAACIKYLTGDTDTEFTAKVGRETWDLAQKAVSLYERAQMRTVGSVG